MASLRTEEAASIELLIYHFNHKKGLHRNYKKDESMFSISIISNIIIKFQYTYFIEITNNILSDHSGL